MKVKKNLCKIDKYIRGVIGIAITLSGVFFGNAIGDPLLQILVIIFGLLNLVSFVTSWCLVYHIASISTLKSEK